MKDRREPDGFKCPQCGSQWAEVIDKRTNRSGTLIRRRRQCKDCPKRFTSYERIAEPPPVAVQG